LTKMFSNLPEKKYYSISEVATHFNVNTSLLRFWEKALKNRFSAKQNKVYRKKHIYTIVGERTYDYIWEQDTPANGGTEFYLLDDDDIDRIKKEIDGEVKSGEVDNGEEPENQGDDNERWSRSNGTWSWG